MNFARDNQQLASSRHWKTEIVASSVEMLSGKRKKDYAAESRPKPSRPRQQRWATTQTTSDDDEAAEETLEEAEEDEEALVAA